VTALGPPRSALAHLERHRIGEGPARCATADRVAVQVEERVQLGERLTAVHLQDRQAGRAESAPVDNDRVGRRRWQRRLARPARLPAVEAVQVPQEIVRVLDVVEDRSALGGPLHRAGVVLLQLTREHAHLAVQQRSLAGVVGRTTDRVDGWEPGHGGLRCPVGFGG